MSQPIDLLDDFSLVVSSANPVSPWALPTGIQQQQPPQDPMHLNSYQSDTNHASSHPVAVSPTQTTPPTTTSQQQDHEHEQRRRQMLPKAHSTYEVTPSHAYPSTLVTTNNSRDTSYQLDSTISNNNNNNNQLVPYSAADRAATTEGPLSTTNAETKLTQMTSIIAKHVPPNSSPLPFLPVHASGYVLSRISFRTLLFKKWKQCYWVFYGSSKLLIFRNKEDADDWRFNPYHTKTERDFLVRLCIDFLNDCKIIQNCRGYKISPLGHKSYGRRKDDLLYHFKLERCMDYGPVIASCFASQDKSEVDNLRKVIIQCIKYALKELKQLHNNSNSDDGVLQQSSSQDEVLSQQQPFGSNDNYVFDYESGKPIPVSEFQNRRHSIQPRLKNEDDNMVAHGRYDENR